MSRLAGRLQGLRRANRKALNTFITAGDPSAAATVPAMHALVAGGADLIELGVPFSDPEADGPAVQAGSERALAAGMTLRGVLDAVAEFRTADADTPVVLMGYLNVFLKMGYAAFCQAAAEAGADGVIVVNLPPEEAGPFKTELGAHGLDLVFLVAPTTTPERLGMIAAQASGFIYYVSYKGTTGAAHLDTAAVGVRLESIRGGLGGLPVLVGFGIRDGASAAAIAPHADGCGRRQRPGGDDGVVPAGPGAPQSRSASARHPRGARRPLIATAATDLATSSSTERDAAALARWLERIGIEHPRGIARGLDHVREVAATLGVLPPAPTTIVVAGTNGKGSTTVFAEQLLLAAGRSVGTTTSPHVHRFNERIRVNGTAASDASIVQAFEAVDAARGKLELSYFEYGVLAALVAIRRADAEFAVLEIGLGGRLDAVNVVDADVAVVTSIGLDHQEYLGDTRELIGAEKAGILRHGRPVVVGDPAPPRSVLDRAAALGAPVHRRGTHFGTEADALWLLHGDRREVRSYGPRWTVDPANAATALQAVAIAGILPSQAHVAAAAVAARNAGRFEVVERGGRTWVLDVAHNPDGARFLASQLGKRFPGRAVRAIVGCLADKDAEGIVAALRPATVEVAFADTGTARGLKAVMLRERAGDPEAFAGDLGGALRHFGSRGSSNDVILVCGSFDLVERARLSLELAPPDTGR